MPKSLKILLVVLALTPVFQLKAALVKDTTNKKLMLASKTMSYQLSDFSVYFKDGLVNIRKDSIARGIRLLSTGFNRALSVNNANRVVGYQVMELANLLTIASKGTLPESEQQLVNRFFARVFAENPRNVIPDLLPYFEKAPLSPFTRRLKVLLLSDEPARFNAELNKLLADEPDLLSANMLKAETLFGKQKFKESLIYCNKVIKLAPEYAHAYHIRAKNYEELKLHTEALNDYNEIIKLFPRHYEALYERANILVDQDSFKQAVTGYLTTLAIRGAYQWCNYNLARAYKGLNMHDSAMYYINVHLNALPNDADGLNIKGEIYYYIDDYGKAIDMFDQAIKNNPTRGDFYEDRGDAYYYKGNIDSAMIDLKKALSINKSRYYLVDRIGNCFDKLGQHDKAISYYTMALKINPGYKYAYVDMGISYNNVGQYQSAISAYQKALAIDSTYVIAIGNTGWSYYCLGDFGACIRYSYKAIALDSEATYAMFNIALATLAKGESEKARLLYVEFAQSCKEKKLKINHGAITDLEELIKKGVAVKEARFIIDHILAQQAQ